MANAPPFEVDLKHALFAASGADVNAQLVFAGTDSFFVHHVRMGNMWQRSRRIVAVGVPHDVANETRRTAAASPGGVDAGILLRDTLD